MSFLIERAAEGEITVVPQGAVYVRMLPWRRSARPPGGLWARSGCPPRPARRKRDILRRLCEGEGFPSAAPRKSNGNRIAELRTEAGRQARQAWTRAVQMPTAAAEAS